MEIESTRGVEIFFSYAHEDQIMRDQIVKHLFNLRRKGLITGWYDRDISVGTDWEHEIDSHLNTAQIILLLVSPDFIYSEYSYSMEMMRALERHNAKEARVIPIILRSVEWVDAPFSRLQVLPTNGRPVKSWPDRDEALLDIVKGIRKAIDSLLVSRKPVEQWLEEGQSFYNIRRYSEALEAYEQAIELDPTNATAYLYKGNVLFELERFMEALMTYEQAIELDPTNATAYFYRGRVFHSLQKYPLALESYDRAIRLDPNNASAYLSEGHILHDLGQYEEALVAFDQVLRLDPNNVAAYLYRGNVLSTLQKYPLALESYDRAIRLDPKNAAAYLYRGNVLSTLQKHMRALESYDRAIRLDPNNASAYLSKGNVLHDLAQYGEALVAYDQVLSLDPNNAAAYLYRGNVLRDLKRFEEALVAYEMAIKLDPAAAAAHLSKGNVLRDLHRFEEALVTYERAIQLEPANTAAYICKGSVLRDLKWYDEALVAYERTLRLDPNNAVVYLYKGDILFDLKRYEEALAAYEQVLSLDPNNTIAYYNKSVTLKNLKRHEEALVTYEQVLHNNPDHAATYYNKSVTLKNLKRYDEALVAYEQALRFGLDPNREDLDFTESPQSLRMKIESVQQFLLKAGFDLSTTSYQVSFSAVAGTRWHERFPRGLYVRVWFDDPLDQRAVQSIYDDAKAFTDHALVVINSQPEISGWMTIGGLRTAEKERFIFLPITESLIKEATALNKEFKEMSFYVNKHLGNDFDPYDVRDPVSDAISFFGREVLTDEILSALRLGQRLGLFGLHKMGKSSVLQRLKKKAEFPVAYVYLTIGDSLFGIYKRILEGWSIDIRIKYPGLQWSIPQFTENSDLKVIFDSSAKDLLAQLGRVTDTPMLGIFLDEIEHIVPYKDNDKEALDLYVNLMDSLRGLQQETSNLSLLVAGVHPNLARRNYFWGDQKNPMYQVIAEKFLLPLDKEDCAYMIRSLGQQINMSYHDSAVEYVIQMSGAHPFLARQICSYAYKNRGDMDTISIQKIQKVVQDFVRDPATASYFDDHGLWGELCMQDIWGKDVSYANHRILITLAASSIELTESQICSELDKKTVKQALSALKERGIISSSDSSRTYFITFGLFRDWIRLHKLDVE